MLRFEDEERSTYLCMMSSRQLMADDKDRKRPLTRYEREDRAITILWIVLFGPFLLGVGLWALYLIAFP